MVSLIYKDETVYFASAQVSPHQADPSANKVNKLPCACAAAGIGGCSFRIFFPEVLLPSIKTCSSPSWHAPHKGSVTGLSAKGIIPVRSAWNFLPEKSRETAGTRFEIRRTLASSLMLAKDARIWATRTFHRDT